jgi:hypothetical protein
MDSDISSNGVRAQNRVQAEEARHMHATLYSDWIFDVQQYNDWKAADLAASQQHDGHVAQSNRDEAQVKAQTHHVDAAQWHHAQANAYANRVAKQQQLAKADMAHAQAAQLGQLAAPEQVVRKVGFIEQEMRKGHIFISGTGPHEAEVERLGMADDNIDGASEVKHVWEVFMEHQRRDPRRRS